MARHERMFPHEHAHRLDDPERRGWLPPDEVMAHLELRPGMVVADIGAGTGYFALPIAAAIVPDGKVHAVDMQPEMLAELEQRVSGRAPVELVLGEAAETTLATASQDLVFCANVWHELDEPDAVLAEFIRILRPGGRVAILDWRVDVEGPPGPPIAHRIPAATLADQLLGQAWSAISGALVGRYSYLISARRPARESGIA